MAPAVQSAGVWANALSKSGGVPVFVSPELLNEAVYFKESGVPLRVAVDGLAQCLHASVGQSGAGYRIYRSSNDTRKSLAIRQSYVANWIESKITALRSFRKDRIGSGNLESAYKAESAAAALRLSNQRLNDVDLRTGFSAQQLLPPQELLENLVDRIGIQEFGKIASGTSEVFEDSPVYGSSALPAHEDLLDKYSESASRAGQFGRAQVDAPLNDRRGHPNNSPSFPDGDSIRSDRLRLVCRMTANQAIFSLEGFDKDGKRNLRAAFVAGPTPVLHHPSQLTKQASRNPTSKFALLAADSLAVWRDLQKAESGDQKEPVQISSWISQPEAKDPLNYFVRNALNNAFADASEKCVAIDVPDSLWALTQMCVTAKGLCLTSWKQAVTEWLPLETFTTGSLLVVRPLDVEFAEAERINRSLLARFAKANHPLTNDTLRDLAPQLTGLSRIGSALNDVWLDGCDVYHRVSLDIRSLPWHYLQLVSAISDPDWERLLAGQPMRVSELGVKDEVSRLLNDEVDVEFANNFQPPDLFRHPLELLGGRSIDDCVVSITTSRVALIRMSGEPRGAWSSAQQFANRFSVPSTFLKVVNGEVVLPFTRAEFESKMENSGIDAAECGQITIQIRFAPNARLTRVVREHVNPEPGLSRYSMLPQDVRDTVWNLVNAQASKSIRNTRSYDSIGDPVKNVPN